MDQLHPSLMARPRVFVSSTYYDLKHIRSSLELFVKGLGFEPVLSEKGSIAYSPDTPLDESCYREAATCDLFVAIIGGRYGSEASPKSGDPKKFYESYDSVCRREHASARSKGVPMYILVERTVFAEYETYLRNKSNNAIQYAHVDSVNVFALIEEVTSQPKNNPIFQFDNAREIEDWLRDQWAGQFRELLRRAAASAQLADLQAQVEQLAELNGTLKTYLEKIVSKVSPSESQQLIETEDRRLDEVKVNAALRAVDLARYFLDLGGVTIEDLKDALRHAVNIAAFHGYLRSKGSNLPEFADDVATKAAVRNEVNEMRAILSLPPLTE